MFWCLKRKVSLILPYSRQYYEVVDFDGTLRPSVNNERRSVNYKEPKIKLRRQVVRVFEICGVRYSAHYEKERLKKYELTFDKDEWKNTTIKENRQALQEYILRCSMPYVKVAASKLIEIERALEEYKKVILEQEYYKCFG